MIAYSFHPEADAEFEEASLFYESRMPGLGRAFAAEIESTISLVREFPEAGSPIRTSHRRAVVARFPYSVVYRQYPEFIVVGTVAHQRRRPGYWRRRR